MAIVSDVVFCDKIGRGSKDILAFSLFCLSWNPFDLYRRRFLYLWFQSDFVNSGRISHQSLVLLIYFNNTFVSAKEKEIYNPFRAYVFCEDWSYEDAELEY